MDERESRIEKAARLSSERFLENVFAAIDDGISVVDRDLRIIRVNPTMQKWFAGRMPLVGKKCYAAYYGRAEPCSECVTSKTIADRTPRKYEVAATHPDGAACWMEVRVCPLVGDDGEVLGAVEVVRDIAERKQAEDKLADYAAELARSNADLRQFAYVASHDLQEPLRMVSSYVRLLAGEYQGKLGDDADEYIGYAVDGAARMRDLINDLLAYARVGTRGKEFAPVDCESVLKKALANLEVAISESGAEVTHDALPTVVGDDGQLTQLLQNLIANAIKFRGAQSPRIHVSARRETGGWHFYVSDNGIGIAPAHLDRVFNMFERLPIETRQPGTGIGLAICKRIVERHGGWIWVESEPGEGSTFHFSIPDRQI